MAASLTPVQAVALEAELRVNRQRLAAAPKNAARAEIELERRADLQFLRMQNDQARRRRGVTAALRMSGSLRCGAVQRLEPREWRGARQLRKDYSSLFEEKRQVEKQLDASRTAELERQAALGKQSPRCAACNGPGRRAAAS